MASGVPLTARALAQSNPNDLQRIANPSLEVNERRLRPIYDYMEIHNYRKALIEIERLLKKQANFIACKALKCLVLLKLDRHDEARILADELNTLALTSTRQGPTGDPSNMDENALTFLSQYYKDLRQFEKVVGIYEAASKREPTSEELLCSLFMAHVRTKDYKNQVFTAQKLYKLTRKIPYHNWAVISVLLQIDENTSQLKQTLYIPMALKMLEKEFFDDNAPSTKACGEMECLLYLHSLELKEDYPKALSFLGKHLELLTKAPSNESMLPAYFSHEKQLVYNFKANHLEDTYRLAKDFLREDNHLWNWYEVLFDTFFQFPPSKQVELINDLHDFVLTIRERTTDLRSVHLARIELGLRWRLWQLKNPVETLPTVASIYLSDSLLNEITSYIDSYSSRTTGLVMHDIYRALEYLSPEDRARLHRFLIDQIDSRSNPDNLQYLINIFYCARLCGDIHRSWLVENQQTCAQRLLELAYQSSTPSSLAVELLLLVATIMEEMGQPPVELYTLLDQAYTRDNAHFDVKLYLYKLALHFNCVPIMKDFFERLEIKNIQYYSLGYLLTDHYLRIHTNYRNVRYFFQYLTNLLLVYTDDSWSQIMFCYKYGNFLRINEIRTFADCYLSWSLTYMQSTIGSMVVDLIQNGNRYASIGTIFNYPYNQVLFDKKQKSNHSLQSLFYKADANQTTKLQDTRDLDIWPKMDHRRLRFDPVDGKSQPHDVATYADRILAESAGPSVYQPPSYKDSFLRENHTIDFQQRTTLSYLRLTVLNLFHVLHTDVSSSVVTSGTRIPDENVFQALHVINGDYEKCIKSLKPVETITPCELQSIVDLELYPSISMFVRTLIDGWTWNKTQEGASAAPLLSLTTASIHFDRIDPLMNDIVKQLERSYQLLVGKLEKTSFQKRCQDNAETVDVKLTFLDDLAGSQSPLELYSVYTEFISYAYGFFLTIRSILATVFNKTALLIDPSDNAAARPATTKKSKKKAAEQQTTSTSTAQENEDEIKLWNHMEKIERVLDEQWTQIITNIRKYERWLREQGKVTDDECERLENEMDLSSEVSAAKFKSKPEETTNENESALFRLGKTLMRQKTIHTFALGYLESFIQIRVALAGKQKTLRLRQTAT